MGGLVWRGGWGCRGGVFVCGGLSPGVLCLLCLWFVLWRGGWGCGGGLVFLSGRVEGVVWGFGGVGGVWGFVKSRMVAA